MIRDRDRRLAFALAITVAVGMSGCVAAARSRRVPLATLPAADDLLAGVAARRQASTSLRAVARISYESADERIGSRHAVVVEQPDRFRLEVLSPLGTLAVVACDGEDLAVWIRRERRTYRGPATPASVAAYAGVPVSAADIVSVLLGLPPARQMIDAPTLAIDPDGSIRVHAPTADGHEDVWFAPDSLLPVASETTVADGTQILRVEFDDYHTVAGVTFPYSIDMRLDPAGRRVRVRYEEPALGTIVARGLFSLPIRPDGEELRLDAYAGGAS